MSRRPSARPMSSASSMASSPRSGSFAARSPRTGSFARRPSRLGDESAVSSIAIEAGASYQPINFHLHDGYEFAPDEPVNLHFDGDQVSLGLPGHEEDPDLIRDAGSVRLFTSEEEKRESESATYAAIAQFVKRVIPELVVLTTVILVVSISCILGRHFVNSLGSAGPGNATHRGIPLASTTCPNLPRNNPFHVQMSPAQSIIFQFEALDLTDEFVNITTSYVSIAHTLSPSDSTDSKLYHSSGKASEIFCSDLQEGLKADWKKHKDRHGFAPGDGHGPDHARAQVLCMAVSTVMDDAAQSVADLRPQLGAAWVDRGASVLTALHDAVRGLDGLAATSPHRHTELNMEQVQAANATARPFLRQLEEQVPRLAEQTAATVAELARLRGELPGAIASLTELVQAGWGELLGSQQPVALYSGPDPGLLRVLRTNENPWLRAKATRQDALAALERLEAADASLAAQLESYEAGFRAPTAALQYRIRELLAGRGWGAVERAGTGDDAGEGETRTTTSTDVHRWYYLPVSRELGLELQRKGSSLRNEFDLEHDEAAPTAAKDERDEAVATTKRDEAAATTTKDNRGGDVVAKDERDEATCTAKGMPLNRTHGQSLSGWQKGKAAEREEAKVVEEPARETEASESKKAGVVGEEEDVPVASPKL